MKCISIAEDEDDDAWLNDNLCPIILSIARYDYLITLDRQSVWKFRVTVSYSTCRTFFCANGLSSMNLTCS